MADIKILTHVGQTYKDLKPKFFNHAHKIDNSKDFTTLDAALTINKLEKMDLFLDTIAEDFKPYYRGKINVPFGQGFRVIQTYGSLPVSAYVCPLAGDTVCLKIPNNVNERWEDMKSYLQHDCSGRKPDYMWGEDKFIKFSEYKAFQEMKVGTIVGSVNLLYYLLQQYILSLDPWGENSDNTQNFADYLQSFGVASLLGFSEDSEAEDKTGILKTIKKALDDEAFKKEIAKERKIANKYAYHVDEWLGQKIDEKVLQAVKVYNSPTKNITDEQLKLLYKNNSQCDPIKNLAAAATAIADRAMEMTRASAKNNSQFCGNMNSETIKTWGQVKDKFWYFCRCRKEDLCIVMNSALLRAFHLAKSSASAYTDKGALANAIDKLLSFRIIGIDNIPYGCIKIHDQHRYNWWTIKEWAGEDTLDQRRVAVWNYHKDILFGIREYPAACVMRIFGLFMYKSTWEAAGQFTTPSGLDG